MAGPRLTSSEKLAECWIEEHKADDGGWLILMVDENVKESGNQVANH